MRQFFEWLLDKQPENLSTGSDPHWGWLGLGPRLYLHVEIGSGDLGKEPVYRDSVGPMELHNIIRMISL